MEPVEEHPADHRSHLDHCENFIRAIRYGEQLHAGTDVGHLAALYAHLGNLSYWANERIIYDGRKRTIINSPKASALVTPSYREPWVFPEI